MNKNFNFSWDFGRFGIRTKNETNEDERMGLKEFQSIELVKYTDREHTSCAKIASWAPDRDGDYDLSFISGKLFDSIDESEIAAVWRQLKSANKMLEEYTRACRYSPEDDGYDEDSDDEWDDNE